MKSKKNPCPICNKLKEIRSTVCRKCFLETKSLVYDNKKMDIRLDYKDGSTIAALTRKYGICNKTIYKILGPLYKKPKSVPKLTDAQLADVFNMGLKHPVHAVASYFKLSSYQVNKAYRIYCENQLKNAV